MEISKLGGATRRLLAGGLLLAAGASGAVDLTSRHSQAMGSFVVGYGGLVDSGALGGHVYDLVRHDTQTTADSGNVSGNVRGTPVQGTGGFLATHTFTVSDSRIDVSFTASASLSTPYSYLSAGAQATSALWLEFRVSEDTPFTLTTSLTAETGNAVPTAGGLAQPLAQASVVLRRTGSSSGGWVIDTAGSQAISGILPSDTYLLHTSAVTKVNSSISGQALLTLSPVPEPGGLALWLAGLAGLGGWAWRTRRHGAARGRRSPQAMMLALAALPLTPAMAAGAFEIGQPVFHAGYVVAYGPTNSVDETQIVRLDQSAAIGGSLGVLGQSGLRRDFEPAILGGTIDRHGQVFAAIAESPWLLRTPAADTPTGGYGFTSVSQSFVKSAADASLRFTYTAGAMELFHDSEFGVAHDNSATAMLRWTVSVVRNDQPGVVLMRESQEAVLTIIDRKSLLQVTQSASDGSPLSPLWRWDCPDCGLRLFGASPATLQAPFTGFVDLSAIPFDPTPGAAQVPFTVTYSLDAVAEVEGRALQASASARDPLGGSGVSFDGSGLLATNQPVGVVPEPASAALLALGTAVLGWWRRRDRA